MVELVGAWNRDTYSETLKIEVFERCGFIPKTILHFFVVLPYHMEISNKARLVRLPYGCDYSLHLVFHELESSFEVYGSKYPYVDKTPRTMVECACAFENVVEFLKMPPDGAKNLKRSSRGYEGDALTLVFDVLNRVAQRYVVMHNDVNVHMLSQHMLDNILWFDWFDGETYDFLCTSYLQLHHYDLHEQHGHDYHGSVPDSVLKEQTLKLLDFSYSDVSTNPFEPSHRFFMEARRFYANGLYAQSVVSLQTSVEVCVFTIYRQFAELGDEYASNKLRGIDEKLSKRDKPFHFSDLYKNHFNELLGIDVEKLLKVENSAVSNHWDFVYMVRNKIVHSGVSVSEDECSLAIRYTLSLLAELFRNAVQRYPELKPYVVFQRDLK